MTCRPGHCHTCSQRTATFYNGERQNRDRCLHNAFMRAGMSWVDENGDITRKHPNNIQDRPTPEEVLEFERQGLIWHELVDMKVNEPRLCSHYVHIMRMAPTVFNWYGVSLEDLDPYMVPDLLRKWFDDGLPVEEKTFSKFRHIQNREETWTVPPEEYTQYNSCSNCIHYAQNIDEEGNPVPYRGTCYRNIPRKGIFSKVKDDGIQIPTFPFLGCSQHLEDPFLYETEPDTFPDKLILFIETNSYTEDMEKLTRMHKIPCVRKRVTITEEQHQEMMQTDLHRILKDTRRQFDHKKFQRDMEFPPINRYFVRRVRRESKRVEEFWNPMRRYLDAEEVLFGERSEPTHKVKKEVG